MIGTGNDLFCEVSSTAAKRPLGRALLLCLAPLTIALLLTAA